MRIEKYKTKKDLDESNRNIREAIKAELEKSADKQHWSVSDFCRDHDCIYVFKEKEVKGVRIDCAKAEDIAGYPKDTEVYYLQVQYRKATYANVVFPAGDYPVTELIEAIIQSMEEEKGVKVFMD
jgi:hypothetical protein